MSTVLVFLMRMTAFNQVFAKALFVPIRYDAKALRMGLSIMKKVPNIPEALSIRRLQTRAAPLLCNTNEGNRVKSVKSTASSSNPQEHDRQDENWFPAWNKDCDICVAMRGLSQEDRGKLQHHIMFQNLSYLLHEMDWKLERRLRQRKMLKSSNILRGSIQQPMRVRCKFMCFLVMTHWDQVFNESIYKPEENKAEFEMIMRLCDQMDSDEYPCDNFNCAEYEPFLRSLRNVARLFEDADDIVKKCTHWLQHEEKNRDALLNPIQLPWKRVFDSISHDVIHHWLLNWYLGKLKSIIVYKFKCHYPHVQDNKTKS